NQNNYSGILYVDYQDMYNQSKFYNESHIMINSSGDWRKSYSTSYASTYPYQYDLLTLQEPIIKSSGVKGTYFDVFTGYNPWSFIDYNQSRINIHSQYDKFNGSIKFNLLWSKNLSSTMHEIHNEPIFSELTVLPYLGLADYVYGTLDGGARFSPNFELFGMQNYMSTASSLWGNYGYSGTPTHLTLRSFITDNIIHNRIGNMYKIKSSGWSEKDVINNYYILNAVQKEQQKENILSIEYWNDTTWVSLSDLLIQ
ncbi:MAG: hypothetical protein KC550_08030, partial [Nanoarchaeota archaeon]|nr:hypothetical protein [Nanoarchaeota archaeon]